MERQHAAVSCRVAGAGCPRGPRATFLRRRGEYCAYFWSQTRHTLALLNRERAWPRWLHASGCRALAPPRRLRWISTEGGSR